MSLKELFKKWQKWNTYTRVTTAILVLSFIVGFLFYFFSALVQSFIEGRLICWDFGGSSSCNALSFLMMGVMFGFWTVVYLGILLTLFGLAITIVIRLLKQKK